VIQDDTNRSINKPGLDREHSRVIFSHHMSSATAIIRASMGMMIIMIHRAGMGA